MLRYFLILLFFNVIQTVTAQDSLKLEVIPMGMDVSEFNKLIKIRTSFYDPEQREIELQKIVGSLQALGYLETTIDSIYSESNTVKAYLSSGPKYEWTYLSKGNLDEGVLAQVGFREKNFVEKPFLFEDVRRLQDRIVTYFENNGYPFAAVKLDSILIENGRVTAALVLNKNKLITIDTMLIFGDPNISERFLFNYLGIHPGDLYNESLIRSISSRINDLPYLQETKPFNITFIGEGARINLFLQSKQASNFNFILGLLPNNEQVNQKLLLTGEANLNLVNPFGTGKSLLLEWRGLRPRSPELNARFVYPYFLGMPVGIDARLNIYKNDTFYINILQELGVQYLFSGNNYIKAFVRRKVTNLISVDTLKIITSKRLPSNIDVSNTHYGLEYHFERYNYRRNPTKGFAITVNGSAGNRIIKPNNKIVNLTNPSDTGFSYRSLYDSLKLKALNFQGSYLIEKFFPIGSRSTFRPALNGGAIISDQIFENELFRIGGINTLRGFDEEALRASIYHILILEYRYLLNQNSYFNLFANGANVQAKLSQGTQEYWPIGLGAGLAFDTKAGMFAVSYALGKLNPSETIQFRNAKIHFGYIGYF